MAVATAIVLVAGCGSPEVSPSGSASRAPGSSVTSTPTPSGQASSGPFVPMVYPEDGPAPCDQDASDRPEYGPYRGSIRRISATDAATVVFELCDSDPAFLAKIASPALAIDDTAWLQTRIDPESGSQRILVEANGTGPFRLDAFGSGRDVTLSRFDRYWGDRSRTGAVVFVGEPDDATRLAKLREGSVDAIDIVAPSDVDAVVENPELSLLPRPGLNVAYIGFNDRFAPFDKEIVRRALSIGIDRRAIVETAFPPGTEVASHFLPCAIPFGCIGGAWPGQDPALAREWLAGVGFADGFATTISYSEEPRDYLPDPTAVATALQTQLREYLGIEATLRVLPFDELVATADAGRLDGIYLLGARARYPDATVLLDSHFGPSSTAQFGRRSEEIGRALERARSTADPAERELNYRRANGRIQTHVPMIPLAHVGTSAAFRSDVVGAHTSAMATERFAALVPGDRTQFVIMQATRPAGLYCPDETDESTLRICAQVFESLYRHDVPEPALTPSLAERCAADADLVTWTCTLRAEVSFHDGSTLDANDVVLSYAVQWDAAHPLHRGRDGSFRAFVDRFGGFLHPPATP
jgi:ABC-type transport system substrate-binding protein